MIAWQRPLPARQFLLLGRGRCPHRYRHCHRGCRRTRADGASGGRDRSQPLRPPDPAGVPVPRPRAEAAFPTRYIRRGSRGPHPTAHRPLADHRDRLRAGRRQRHRGRHGGVPGASLDPRPGDLLGRRRRGGAAHPVRPDRHAAADHRRADAGGRHPAAVGVLEDVPRDHAVRAGRACVRGAMPAAACRPRCRP